MDGPKVRRVKTEKSRGESPDPITGPKLVCTMYLFFKRTYQLKCSKFLNKRSGFCAFVSFLAVNVAESFCTFLNNFNKFRHYFGIKRHNVNIGDLSTGTLLFKHLLYFLFLALLIY